MFDVWANKPLGFADKKPYVLLSSLVSASYLYIAPLSGYMNCATARPNDQGPFVRARILSCAILESGIG